MFHASHASHLTQALLGALLAALLLEAGRSAWAEEPTLASLGEHRRSHSGDATELSARTTPHIPATGATADDPALAALMHSFLERLEPSFVDPVDRDHRAIPDGELLVFQIKIGRYSIDAPVTGVKQGRGVMIPIGEFARALYLAIEVDPEAARAEGWAFSEDHQVVLDARAGVVQAGDVRWNVRPDQVEEDGIDILVHTDVLSEWLGFEFDIDFRFLLMRIDTDKTLPIIEQLERRKRAAQRADRPSPQPVLPPQDAPYQIASAPTLDAQTTYSFRESENGTTTSQLSHSVIASGDLAKMSGIFFLSGDDNDAARVRRLTLSRVSPEAGIAGPLHATRVELGDVQGVDLPFSSGTQLQRGVTLTNAPVGSVGAFGVTDITGDVQPGWDVELYRNNVFLGLQTVGADGRYSFPDVALFAGPNQFRIVSYGPQGQVREDTRTLSANPAGSGERLIYDISVAEQGRALLGGASELGGGRSAGLRATGHARMQISDNVVADVGVDTPVLADGRHHQVLAGLSGTVASTVTRANMQADLGGGLAGEISAARPLLKQQVRVSHAAYNNFPASGADDGDISGSTTQASLAGVVSRVSYQLDAERDNLRDVHRRRVEGRASAPILGVDVDTGLRWSQDRDEDGAESLIGSLGASHNSRRLLTRARVSADMNEGELADADLSARYRFNNDISVNGRVQSTFATGETIVEARGDWDLGRMEIGPRAQWSSEGDWSALVDGRVSLGWDPLRAAPRFSSTRGTGAGAVSVRVFEDIDGDGAFSRGDTLIEGAGVDAVQARRTGVSDDKGLAFLERLPAYRRTDVQIDRGSLEDPYLAPVEAGVSVEPRPGRIQTLDIPLVATSEVEGSVSVRTARGTIPVPGALVRAVDAQGEVRAEARTATDGFFVLSHMPVGTYRLLLERDVLDERGWRPDQASFITVRRAREIVVRNISLAARDAPRLDALEGRGVERVSPDRLAAALEERQADGGFALSLGAYHTQFGRNAALMILLARFPEELDGLGLVTPDASPLGDGLLTIGPVATAEEANQLCERFGDAVKRCRLEPLGFRAPDLLLSETAEAPSKPRRSVAALRRLRPGGG